MRKFLIGIVFAIGCMSLVSCVTTVSAQDDMYGSTETVVVDDNTQIEVVITYGTPYIIDGLVQYYIYNNLYYYPYYYRNHFYWRMYRSPLLTYPRYWRPMPRAYWYRGGKFYHPRNFDRRHYDNVIRHNHHRPHYDNRNGRGGQNHNADKRCSTKQSNNTKWKIRWQKIKMFSPNGKIYGIISIGVIPFLCSFLKKS